MAIPVGSAAGYLVGGSLAHIYGWRFPFYVGAGPGFLLALAVLFLKEPERGQFDTLRGNPERSTVFGLLHNRALLTPTVGMAAMIFSLGGIPVWMPQFLYSERHYYGQWSRPGIRIGCVAAMGRLGGASFEREKDFLALATRPVSDT